MLEATETQSPIREDDADAKVSDRDLQRGALRELVSLATDCARTETQIEQALASELVASERELAKAISSAELRNTGQVDALRQQYEERTGKITSQERTQSDEMRTAEQSARRKIEHEYNVVETDCKQKLQQAVWLAESVFEGTQVQIKDLGKKAKEEYKSNLESIDEMDRQVVDCLATYAVKVPPVPEPPESDSIRENPKEAFDRLRDLARMQLRRFGNLLVPGLFVGSRPYVIATLVLAGAGVLGQASGGVWPPSWENPLAGQPRMQTIGVWVGVAAVALAVVGVALRVLAKSTVRHAYVPLARTMSEARAAAKAWYDKGARERDEQLSGAVRQRDSEIQATKDKLAPLRARASRHRQERLAAHDAEFGTRSSQVLAKLAASRSDTDTAYQSGQESLRKRLTEETTALTARHEGHVANARARRDRDRAALELRWSEGLTRIQAPIGEQSAQETPAPLDWNIQSWKSWKPPKRFASAIRFGQFKVDVGEIIRGALPEGGFTLPVPDTFALPALLAFPSQASLLLQTDHPGRADSLRAMQLVMTRLLTCLPAGRVRFTMIDPVGLGQNFAGFMHLADHDEALIGGRIWTESDHIEQRLSNLTEHMETVIQKYLRNEFDTIDAYNAQAGELAEPYRFLVIADFPTGFTEEAIRRLNSIASTGARCGVYTLVMRDTRQTVPSGAHLDELLSHSVVLDRKPDGFVWRDDVFKQFPLTVDAPPPEDVLTQILDIVGRHARDANRVEVPFETIAPKPEQFWSHHSNTDLKVPIGRMGATRQQQFRLGKGVAQHALIAGKTGSGKSTLLHAIVTNLAMWYSPDEIELYLVDFKKGVEFKTYATHELPHARAIAVESDREFGLSVLHRIDAELTRRGNLFRKFEVQDLNAYRAASKEALPRTMLIIDEFQEFFSEDDKLAQDAGLLLDRLVRQGRAFGIHVLLGSQTIGGSSGLARTTIGQMAVRVALQTSEADSQLILGDGNSAARLLSRPGEAIYNDAGGLVEANSPFQVAWLPDEQRDGYLAAVRKRANTTALQFKAEPAVVFEGNAPADLAKNRKLAALLDPAVKRSDTSSPVAWLGDPVAIKDPTAVVFRRQSGSNLLIIGQQEESAIGTMIAAIISLSVQFPRDHATFHLLDGSASDSPFLGVLPRLKGHLPQHTNVVDYRATETCIDSIHQELLARRDGGGHPQPIFLCIYGLQRYRALRKQEESFGFSSSDEPKKPQPDKQFAEILREGPAVGIHVIAWIDTSASIDRTIDRASMREFDNRVLFQMSANDSSNLIDSPAANKLGFYRAIAFSEEQGVMEKFRPYAAADAELLGRVTRAVS